MSALAEGEDSAIGRAVLDYSGARPDPVLPLAVEEIFAAFGKDAKHPKRTPFVAAKNPALAEQVIRLLKKT